jgi:hypothetical protein
MTPARVGFTATDAERQTALSAENYLNRALRMLAERLGWEKLLENDPAGFATRFAPLLAALIEAQAREYQSWVFYDRLGGIADANRAALEELGKYIAEAAQCQADATREGLAGLCGSIEWRQP